MIFGPKNTQMTSSDYLLHIIFWKEIIPPSIDLKIWLKWIKVTFSWICWTYSQHTKVDQNVDTLVQKNFTSARCTFWWSMNGHVRSRCVPASTCPQNGINSVRDMLCWRDTMWRPRLLVHFGNIWVSRSIYGATPKQTAQKFSKIYNWLQVPQHIMVSRFFWAAYPTLRGSLPVFEERRLFSLSKRSIFIL